MDRFFLHFVLLSAVVFFNCVVSQLPDWCSAIEKQQRLQFPQCSGHIFGTPSPVTAPTKPVRPLDDWRTYLVKGNNDPHPDFHGEASADYFEGDIRNVDKDFNASKAGLMANAVRDPKLKWSNGVIPYEISSDIPERERRTIQQGMDTFHEKTCIRFVPRSDEQDYISIESAQGRQISAFDDMEARDYQTRCNSYIGKIGGPQPISLQLGQCYTPGKVEHELMHAVGFLHEQSRTDRDDYVMINWDNIPEDIAKGNFQKYGSDIIDSLGAPYDYGSVMHYGPFFFAIDPNMWTMLPRQKGKEIGQRRTMSDIDVWKVNKMYSCQMDNRNQDKENEPPKGYWNKPQCATGWSQYADSCYYFSRDNGREYVAPLSGKTVFGDQLLLILHLREFLDADLRQLSWIDAEDVCKALLGSLVTIKDDALNQFITNKFKDVVDTVWIAARIPDSVLRWYTVAGPKELSYINWADMEPKNCAVINKEGKWQSVFCEIPQDFICERPLNLSKVSGKDQVATTKKPAHDTRNLYNNPTTLRSRLTASRKRHQMDIESV